LSQTQKKENQRIFKQQFIKSQQLLKLKKAEKTQRFQSEIEKFRWRD